MIKLYEGHLRRVKISRYLYGSDIIWRKFLGVDVYMTVGLSTDK